MSRTVTSSTRTALTLQQAVAQAPTLAGAPDTPAPLESLALLEGKAPSKRTLDIQRWQTAEGARVLFVEARELPMFDLRLTFAAGSTPPWPGLAP